jgi:ankyrin repeat protein
MKRRKRICVSLMTALLLLGGFCWLAYRVVRQERLNRQLIAAIKHNQIDHRRGAEVLACLKRGADPNTCDDPSQPVLSWDRLLILFGLRKAPAIPKQPALLLAVEGDINRGVFDHPDWYWGDADIVKALLEFGADIHVKDKYGRTPLVAAFSPVPRALLVLGENINFPHWDCELALITAGADVEARDEFGETALMASGGGYGSAVEVALLRKGANVNARTEKGCTALYCRAFNGDEEGCRFLLDQGADVNADGGAALMIAAQNGHDAMVDTLLKHGANVNANIGQGRTALMAAASGGHSAIMQTLLQHGAVVDAQDENGWTALTWAARDSGQACVRLLLDRGASVTKKDKSGDTLYRLVKDNDDVGNRAMIRLLKAHGMREQ